MTMFLKNIRRANGTFATGDVVPSFVVETHVFLESTRKMQLLVLFYQIVPYCALPPPHNISFVSPTHFEKLNNAYKSNGNEHKTNCTRKYKYVAVITHIVFFAANVERKCLEHGSVGVVATRKRATEVTPVLVQVT
jgi:hypothetical protein